MIGHNTGIRIRTIHRVLQNGEISKPGFAGTEIE